MKLSTLLLLLLVLIGFDIQSGYAQNTVGDYSRVQKSMDDYLTLVAGFPTSEFKISESRIERNGSSYTRRFTGAYEYRLVAFAPEEASRLRLTVTCDGSSPMRRADNGTMVSLSFRLASSKTCKVTSEVVETTRPDIQHFVGMIILFDRP